MKLIIDIPDDVYEALNHQYIIISGARGGKSITNKLLLAVSKGIPFEEREEIRHRFSGRWNTNKECYNCGFWDSDREGCMCLSGEKFYACPIESAKPENQEELRKMADWYANKKGAE